MKEPVIAATDFSDASESALAVAEDLARKLDAPLELVHVLEHVPVEAVSGPEFGPFAHSMADRAAALDEAMRDALGERLRARAAEMTARGTPATARVLTGGRPWDSLVEIAEREKASFIVMGTHGRRGPARWLLGSVAERTVRGATCPVIVTPARKADVLTAWSRGTRPLRAVVAVDLGDSAPIEAVRRFRRAGGCDVTAVHLYWPPSQMKRHEVIEPFELESPPAAIQERVTRELGATVGELPGKGELTLHVRPEWGRLSDPLLRIAGEREADLLVLGTHGRHVLEGFAAGSTAYGVLKRIDRAVVFVPPPRPG